MQDPVVRTIVVPCSAATAFAVFTRDMTKWWPLASNTVSAMTGTVARGVTMEEKLGGAVVEIAGDGSRLVWGKVTDWQPGRALAFDWHAGDTPDRATHVKVAFADREGGARVTLTHSGWEVLGEQAQGARNGYDQGWVNVFDVSYAAACRKAA